MKLNDLHYTAGSRPTRKRVGRGPGSDLGKTAGRGHKGQRSRTGGYIKAGFEGGQMPLQRRIPKRGFRAPNSNTVEVRLDQLDKFEGDVDLATLKEAGVVPRLARLAKVIASGKVSTAVHLRGVSASAGACKAIEAAGGAVTE